MVEPHIIQIQGRNQVQPRVWFLDCPLVIHFSLDPGLLEAWQALLGQEA